MPRRPAERLPRLTQPLVRRDGVLRPASWDEALDVAAGGFRRAIDDHGPDAFGMFSCSKATNEVNYLRVKAFRAGLGILPIEQQARI